MKLSDLSRWFYMRFDFLRVSNTMVADFGEIHRIIWQTENLVSIKQATSIFRLKNRGFRLR